MVPAAGADGGLKLSVARLTFELAVAGPFATVSVRGEDETCDVPVNTFAFYVDRRAPLRRVFECALAGLTGVTARGGGDLKSLNAATSRDLLGALAWAITNGLKTILGGDDGTRQGDRLEGQAGPAAGERPVVVVGDGGSDQSPAVALS